MTTTAAKRPSTARKVTTKTEAKRKSVLEQGIRLTMDGEIHEIRFGDITDKAESRLRREWGGSFSKLQEELEDDPGLDTFAALVWFCRIVSGEDISLDEVTIGYGSAESLDVTILDGSEVQPNPEA